MKLVLDSSALIAYLQDEHGAEMVDSLLMDLGNEAYVHSINTCEVYYDFLRRADEPTAQSAVSSLLSAGITNCEDMDSSFWQRAGYHKAMIRRISLADCFCVSLAERLEAKLITADHHEFDPIVNELNIETVFIR